MMISHARFLREQTGQAMTEFVVSVAFVFLPLFVFVPMFGKIMDLQFQTQQASRYVAWERTVWFDTGYASDDSWDNFEISSDEFESLAVRSDDELMNSMSNRFFYGHGSSVMKGITDDDLDAPGGNVSPLWSYVQSKDTMYGGTTLMSGTNSETGKKRSLDGQETPSFAYDIWGFVDDVVSAVTDPIGDLLGFADDFLTFPAIQSKNYYSPVIQTSLNIGNAHGGGSDVWDRQADGSMGRGIESALFQDGEGNPHWDGTLNFPSAILADGWNAQSLTYYEERADDFVLSSVFDNAVMDAVIDVASIFEGGPSNSSIDKLEFGAVGTEPMPAEDGQPLDVSCDDGFCYYDE